MEVGGASPRHSPSTSSVPGNGVKPKKNVASTRKRSNVSESSSVSPPDFTPLIFEDCGKELAVTVLDIFDEEMKKIATESKSFGKHNVITDATTFVPPKQNESTSSLTRCFPDYKGSSLCSNKYSRITASQYKSLGGVKSWLHQFLTSPSSNLGNTSHYSPLNTKMSPKLSPLNSATRASKLKATKNPDLPKQSPKQLRSRSLSRGRKYSRTSSVDAENREPVAGSSKKGLGGAPKSKTYKGKSLSPKKSTARALNFTDIVEGNSPAKKTEKKKAASKIKVKQGLTQNVCLTPNLNVKLSVSEVPEIPTIIKKVEKVRRQRTKPLSGTTKKLKTGEQVKRSASEKDSPEPSPSKIEIHSSELPTTSHTTSPRSPLSCVFQGTSSESSKLLKVSQKGSVKRRAKVSRTISKSMDILPSILGSEEGQHLTVLPSNQSKIVRKKMKKSMSGSESDISFKQTDITPVEPSISTGSHKVGSVGLQSSCSDSLPGSSTNEATSFAKKKKRKIQSRKSL